MTIMNEERLEADAPDKQAFPSHINMVTEAILGQIEYLKELQTGVSSYHELNIVMMSHMLKEDEELVSLFQKYKTALLDLAFAFIEAEPVSVSMDQDHQQGKRNEIGRSEINDE